MGPTKFIEREMIELIANGFNSKEMSIVLKFTHASIQTYRINLLRRYNVKNTAELIAYCYDNGILKPLYGNETKNENIPRRNELRGIQNLENYQAALSQSEPHCI